MVLLVLGLELLEEVDQRLRALDGHGVVNARAQTADGLVALEVIVASSRSALPSRFSIRRQTGVSCRRILRTSLPESEKKAVSEPETNAETNSRNKVTQHSTTT